MTTVFWLLILSMTLLAMAIVLRPLWLVDRPRHTSTDSNVLVLRSRLRELRAEYRRGELSRPEYLGAQAELEQELLQLCRGRGGVSGKRRKHRWSIIPIASMVPLLAFPLYLGLGGGHVAAVEGRLGTPAIPRVGVADEGPDIEARKAQIRANLAHMEREVVEDPTRADRWLLLANAYIMLNKHALAAEALGEVRRLRGDGADLLIAQAQQLFHVGGEQHLYQASLLLARALELEPEHAGGLWLAGRVAVELGSMDKAHDYWSRLVPLLPPDNPLRAQIQALSASAPPT
ncbi:c-type cytochrome biogenesis protein CcmI [Alkalilimnicola ehrlichii]|uniref:C-type cytochrome biogenesis protein CcmI n=1 Tax=Alkalilimnicola ehrlichii TaxID=351052 RepID=A0A3E0WU71_9GAMM|nr:c-type cytochrome biogenesis protein CcmI [Alkalilimnicola ehrlichii]RFA28569.1 c-type cytochrome biogenesis protein CcmI [Alkalilimnicola ehrlichii]RFA35733.1 c-type cytochrome biogenesis protein CcmI [Alkalilimnicola ehrlichii]